MYFPYLRGKQYELIALRELIEKGLISNNILPIIEPVKLSPTLDKTIDIATTSNFKLALIFNPQVGDVTRKREKINSNYLSRVTNNSLLYGYITNERMYDDISIFIDQNDHTNNQILLVHINDKYADEYRNTFSNEPPIYNLIPDQRSYSRKVSENRVIFEDRFTIQKRNADYAEKDDEFFSEDHLYYSADRFLGFSDYCTIGSNYTDGGFRPYAVVIHVTYLDNDNTIRIKHFVSNTNDDSTDTPRKFREALTKLIEWKNDSDINTHALGILQTHYDNDSYPSLGPLKKLSVMHHLELVDQYLRSNSS